MWSPRTQNDRMLFASEWRQMLEQTPNVDFFQDMVQDVLIDDQGSIKGVRTGLGIEIEAKSVILTSGTFLNGLIHIGDKNFGGGRAGEKASFGITEQLVKLGFEHGRMKTGTPPRLDGRSLDYSKMEVQPGDEMPGKFSFSDTKPITNQRTCHITYTNPTRLLSWATNHSTNTSWRTMENLCWTSSNSRHTQVQAKNTVGSDTCLPFARNI